MLLHSVPKKICNDLFQSNVGGRSPNVPGSLVEQLRARALEQVQLEAERLRAQPSTDTGPEPRPFYGLPAKVQHMFHKHRGISTLYGRYQGNR